MGSVPIADLSYRGYDGPMAPPKMRWWVIAKASMRMAIKKKGFWVWASLSTYWYAILMVFFYVASELTPNVRPGELPPLFANIVWKDQFLDAFSFGQLFYLIIALLIGAGSIANDNRANALLVYLSKPCTKTDYIVGKWVGIFVPITCVVGIPMILFYGYCVLSYREYGFISQDPWLFFKLLAIIPIPGIFHASVVLGVSSLFNQGRLAGATYAGLYFLTNFATKIMQVIRFQAGRETPPVIDNLFYGSIDGIQIGLAKIILGTNGSPLFQQRTRGITLPPAPNPTVFFIAFFLVCGIAILLAWKRIRAVEVVN